MYTTYPEVSADLPMTDIVFIQSWPDDSPGPHGDPDEIANYLVNWDYGQETDEAHTMTEPSVGSSDDIFVIEIDGLTYWLSLNVALGYASLSRRPL